MVRVLTGTVGLLPTRSALMFVCEVWERPWETDLVTHDVVVGPGGTVRERLLVSSDGRHIEW